MQDGSIYLASFPEYRPKKMGEIGDRVYQATWSQFSFYASTRFSLKLGIFATILLNPEN
jgi:hypothetical protein